MTNRAELEQAVAAAFAVTASGLAPWPDPHPDRAPLDEEYSRTLDPAKWRIVPARAEAWARAAVELGIADLERDVEVRWAVEQERRLRRVDRVVPRVACGLPLVLGYAGFEGEDINAVTMGAGDPAVELSAIPPYGCDACDSGSQDALDELDETVRNVVLGRARHLRAGSRSIIALGRDRWSASGSFADGEVEAALAHPAGWVETSGPSWLHDASGG